MTVETERRSGDESQQVREWVFPLLSTDPVLAGLMGVSLAALPDHVWPEQAPGDVERRWLVYDAQTTAVVVDGLGSADRIMVPVPLNVRVIANDADSAWAYPAARRVHALLHGNVNHYLPGGGLILTCRRRTVLDYPEDAGGIRYRHVGGIYTVQVN